MDSIFNEFYRSDERTGRLFGVFAFMGIFIACLGLFGLASFTAEQRTKEIGIRKVMGASIPNVLQLLSREFIKWVIIANIFAWPAGYFVMNWWLENFAYRISIGVDLFLIAGCTALVISLVTVSYQALKAALKNPAESLRFE